MLSVRYYLVTQLYYAVLLIDKILKEQTLTGTNCLFWKQTKERNKQKKEESGEDCALSSYWSHQISNAWL